jgi:hypothetical protein
MTATAATNPRIFGDAMVFDPPIEMRKLIATRGVPIAIFTSQVMTQRLACEQAHVQIAANVTIRPRSIE